MSASETHNPADPVVLIVEDNRVNQLLLIEKFKKQGFSSVLLAENGQNALELALKKKPQLVLMDIQLPDMSGNAVIKRLRDSGFSNPIVALSADTLAQDRERSLAAGANGYITKPIDFNVFFDRIDGYLRKINAAAGPLATGDEAAAEDASGLRPERIAADVSAAAKNIFISDGKEKLHLLAEALAHAGDPEQMARIKAIAHEYKGSAGYFGLGGLERIARELDSGFSDQAPPEHLVRLTRRLVEMVQAIIDENQ